MQFFTKDFKDEDFKDLAKLKGKYYPRLFKSLFNFKLRFRIKDDQSVESLEKKIGSLIEEYKLNWEGTLASIKFRVLD